MSRKRPRNGPEMVQKWPGNGPEIAQKWTRKRLQNPIYVRTPCDIVRGARNADDAKKKRTT